VGRGLIGARGVGVVSPPTLQGYSQRECRGSLCATQVPTLPPYTGPGPARCEYSWWLSSWHVLVQYRLQRTTRRWAMPMTRTHWSTQSTTSTRTWMILGRVWTLGTTRLALTSPQHVSRVSHATVSVVASVSHGSTTPRRARWQLTTSVSDLALAFHRDAARTSSGRPSAGSMRFAACSCGSMERLCRASLLIASTLPCVSSTRGASTGSTRRPSRVKHVGTPT
jgi:hypothetical protein